MDPQLSAEGENVWLELRSYAAWVEGITLIFIFCSNPRITDILRIRLNDYLRGKVTALHVIDYQATDAWLENTLSALLSRDERYQRLESPVWLELNRWTDPPALDHYSRLLSRLNERREALRERLPYLCVFAFPESMHKISPKLAPDLWSIRIKSYTLTATEHLTVEQMPPPEKPLAFTYPIPSDPVPSSTEYHASLIREWLRLRKKEAKDRSAMIAAARAGEAFLETGGYAEAQETAEYALRIARNAASHNESAETLRDLSVSLDRLGDVLREQGRLDDARAAFEESLELARRLRELLGDSPQTLRDLSVSMTKLGPLAFRKGDKEIAKQMFQEGVEISRRYIERYGEVGDMVSMRRFFLERLKELQRDSASLK